MRWTRSALSWNGRNALSSSTTTYNGLAGKTISYTFHNDGSRAAMSTPAGSFSYTYDGDARLSSLSNPFSETSGWSYLDNGWLSTQTLGNGAVTTFSYNGLGEMTELLNQDNASHTLSEFSSLVYNASGSRTSATAALTGVSSLSGSLSYSYDSKDELTSDGSTRSAGSYTHSFSHDSAGNPTTWMGGSKSFNSDNQNTANTFDGNGNPTTYDSTTLTFDPESRMTAFGSALTAGYRAGGLRAWKEKLYREISRWSYTAEEINEIAEDILNEGGGSLRNERSPEAR